jgi:N-methylhydantoinase A
VAHVRVRKSGIAVSFVIGIDIGGTFTDGVAVDIGTSTVVAGKTPTTSPDLLPGVLATLEELGQALGRSVNELLRDCVKFVHGTTLTTNVLLERRGARVGLVATQGFGDAILMMSGKGRVAGLSLMQRRHFRATDKPEPIVPRERIVEISERVDSDGEVVIPLTEEGINNAIGRLMELGVDACAVALLWSFRNPLHERQISAAIHERFPGLYVSVSSDLAPLLGEYERTATAVVNAYVGPAVTNYLANVEDALKKQGVRSPLLVVQSSGGVAEVQQTEPVNTIESGPAAGVRGSVHLLEQIDQPHAIVTDVGGTTFKVSIVRERDPGLTTETVLGQYSLLVPMIDIVSIGAGGGSIAWLDAGRLRVGPTSAGSSPGPACYDWGGVQPTVTDADLLLGYLDPDYFLGGRMKLSVDAARRAIAEHIADPLFNSDAVSAAAGIREIIDTQMADLIRKASLERGHDPREFVVLAYGGAGPVHCGAYAAELGCREIVVPHNATVYSAFGAAVSDLQHSFQIARQSSAPGQVDPIRRDFLKLERKARDVLRTEGIADEAIRIAPWADMRYKRQFYELRIPLGVSASAIDSRSLGVLAHRFEENYGRRYGDGARHGAHRIEYVRFGVEAIGHTPRPAVAPAQLDGARPEAALKGERVVYWREEGGLVATPIYDGTLLAAGVVLEGPTVIEHPGTSIAVHPRQRARIDAYRNTIIELDEGGQHAGGRSRHI